MASNSKREQLIVANVSRIQTVSEIKTVQRVQPTYAELETFAQTQFPVAAVVGRLPVPEPKEAKRGVPKDQFIMELKTDIYIYIQVAVDPDTLVSNIADDMWVALLADQERGGLAISTEVTFDDKQKVYRPFAAFQMTVSNKYVTGIGGI